MERYIDTRFTHDTSLIRYYRSPLSNKSLNKSSQMSKMGTSWEKICRNFAKFLPIHFGGFWRESRLSFSLSLLLSSVFLSFCYPLKSKFGSVREKWRFHSISSPKKKKKIRPRIGPKNLRLKKGIRWLWDTLYTHPPPFPRSTPMSSPLSDYWSGCSTGAALLLNVIWLLLFLHSYDMQHLAKVSRSFTRTCYVCMIILCCNK